MTNVFARLQGARQVRYRPARGRCTRLGVGLLLTLAATGRARAQCPDGTPPPCGPRRATPAPNSVAVIGFENAAHDTSLDWMGDGLAEEVATQLGAARGVTVRGAGIVRSAVGVAGRDPRRVAQLVSVRYVVEGSYRRVGERVRVSARLLALPAGDQRWGRVYDRSRDSLATLSDAIAQDLATALGARPRRVERRPPHPLAYEAYQRGRSFFLRYDFPTARSLFEEAIGRDSTFAPAWAGLALAWTELADLMIAPRDAFPRAREAARRALALDSTIATAYIALANVTWALDLDCRGGVRLADRAIALDSTLTEAWSARAGPLICLGRGPEALEAARHAWELDSLSAYTGLGVLAMTTLLQPQSLPEALALMRYRVGAPAAYFEGVVAQQRGDCAAAERLIRPIAASDFSNGTLMQYVSVLVCLGRRSEADSVVRAAVADSARRYVNPVAVAGALLALGDRDGAMRWLERGADERTAWVTQIQSGPYFEPLRGDPRFEAFKRRLGLQP